jgi:ABC-2 type transport system permease protein
MWKLCIKNFVRTSVAQVGISAVLIAGIISLLIGRQHLVKQQEAVKQTMVAQNEHINRNKEFFSAELGLLFYYLKFSLVNELDPINGLSIGQRDVNPSIQSVTIRNLENQRYDTDLYNPTVLQAGNLDLSFVLLYLFPLLIIASCYSVLSADQEAGTWNMTRVQARKPAALLWKSIVIRMGFVFSLFFVLIGLAFVVLPLSINYRFLLFVGTGMAYLLFWFGLCAFIISLNKNSSTNAMLLLSCWILLAIILPAAVNNYLTSRYPVPEALSTMVEQREAYHEKWDMEKTPTLKAFYKVYPEYEKYGYPQENFSWLWYYAMQHLGDEESKEQSASFMNKLAKRETAARSISFFIPTLHTQHQFNSLAKAGLENHLLFLRETANFHESVRKQVYPLIFGNQQVDEVDWKALSVQKFEENQQTDWVLVFLPFLVFILGLFGISWKRLHSMV